MAVMLEISADHIAALADNDLRTLIGFLCEAELRMLCLPISAVTWGGHQDAADGGIDVRVALPAGTHIEGFVPRAATGFQVKAEDMPRACILREMCPRGAVRPSIQELAGQSGAYILVSSHGSTSDTPLRNRRGAMAEAVRSLSNANSLFLDFYDRSRVATWVRGHAGLIPWVREKAGEPTSGWHSYGSWAYLPAGLTASYLVDEAARIQTRKKEDANGLSVLQGIKRIRGLLNEPGNVVRLIGLSGVGKTRLVQALFDERVGDQSLDPSLPIYTNMADNPDPQPMQLALHLVNIQARNILIVDNCPPDLHRRLSEVCRSPESALSVITIEYDIREDEPEETEVFELKSSSLDLIEKLIHHRFPDVSNVDLRTVAQFSDGNARIALALAATIKKNETFAGFSDDELFTRLFQQRHEHDASLLLAAQACSLVYSFQGEQISGEDAELPRLGALIGKAAQEIFGSIAELRRRDLAQQRGVWRAVLPHAIANRLATIGLQNIPFDIIEAQLINSAPERLLKSFSRRLGYLNSSPNAVSIAERWLAIDGLLGNVGALNELGRTMLNNIAPIAPEAALCALERMFNGPPGKQPFEQWQHFIPLLHSLAYEASLFNRCAVILIKLAGMEKEEAPRKGATAVFVSLFYIFLSGTHAPLEHRLQVIEILLQSPEPQKQDLGLKALEAALEAWRFAPVSNFEFGAHSRNYGYWPQTREEVRGWLFQVLRLVEITVSSNRPIGRRVRHVLAQQFRGLWKAEIYDALERLCQIIGEKEHWSDGWIAVRQTWQYDYKGLQSEVETRLRILDEFLRPQNLIQRVLSIVLATSSGALEIGNLDDAHSTSDAVTKYEQGEMIACELGASTATDEHALNELLPELVKARDRERLWSFGRGLAAGAKDPKRLWDALTVQLSMTPKDDRSMMVFGGFIQALHDIDPYLVDTLLDQAVEHETLAQSFPLLQATLQGDEKGVRRLNHAIALGKAPIHAFRCLASGRWSDPLSGIQLKNMLLSIAKKPGGFDVALHILYMRIFSDTRQKRTHDPNIILAGRQLLREFPIDRNHGSIDNSLGDILETCLAGPDGINVTLDICTRLKIATAKRETYAFHYDDVFRVLLKVQPIAVLDALFDGDEQERQLGLDVLKGIDSIHNNSVMVFIPDNEVVSWCKQQPLIRYPLMASLVDIFHHSDAGSSVQWTTIAARLLETALQPVAVLEQFVKRLEPVSWSGSRAAILEARVELFRQLETHTNPLVGQYATGEYARLRQAVEEMRQYEKTRFMATDQRFEW